MDSSSMSWDFYSPGRRQTDEVSSQLILPVENIMRLGVQQDVQVHTPAHHLGGSLHQAAAQMKEENLVCLQAAQQHEILCEALMVLLPEDLWNSLQAPQLSIFSQQGFHPLQNLSGVHLSSCHSWNIDIQHLDGSANALWNHFKMYFTTASTSFWSFSKVKPGTHTNLVIHVFSLLQNWNCKEQTKPQTLSHTAVTKVWLSTVLIHVETSAAHSKLLPSPPDFKANAQSEASEAPSK